MIHDPRRQWKVRREHQVPASVHGCRACSVSGGEGESDVMKARSAMQHVAGAGGGFIVIVTLMGALTEDVEVCVVGCRGAGAGA